MDEPPVACLMKVVLIPSPLRITLSGMWILSVYTPGPTSRMYLLVREGAPLDDVIEPSDYHVLRENSVNRLADCISKHLDTTQLGKILNLDAASV